MTTNPYYENFKVECLEGEGINKEQLGPFYKGVLFQRGYGLAYQELPLCQTYGLGLGESLSNLFYSALPMLKKGLQYLGTKAVHTAANIAEDALKGKKISESTKEHVGQTARDIWAKAPAAIASEVYKTSDISPPGISTNPIVKQKRRKKPAAVKIVKSTKKRGQGQFGQGLLATYPLLGQL